MIDFIRAEWLRLRTWTLLIATVHLVALAFASRMVDLAQVAPMVLQAIAGAYFVLGFLLGLYQVGGYRRPSTWVSLLHRPVSPARIGGALLIAGAAQMLVMIALPVLVVAVWQDAATARVVDVRHYLLAPAGVLVGLAGYLDGAYVMLRGRRQALVVLTSALLLATSQWSGAAALAFQCALVVWLAARAVAAFRPDPVAPPRRATASVLACVPLVLAGWMLLVFGGYVFETAWILQGSHPNNAEVAHAGGHNEVERMEGGARMIAALRGSAAPDAALLREQIGLSDVYEVTRDGPDAPGRTDLTRAVPGGFVDQDARTLWTFSRDRMRFEGRSTADGRRAGELGLAGDRAFPAIVVPAGGLGLLDEGDLFLVGDDTLYHYDARARRIVARLRLPERIAGIAPVGEGLALLGATALYFVDGRDVAAADEPLVARRRMALRGALDDLSRLDIIERVEGHLVAFTYSAHAHEPTRIAPFQAVVELDDDGRARLVARRALAFDYPALFRYRSWWPSPAGYALFNALRGATDAPGMRVADLARIPLPARVAAALSMLLAAVTAAWWTRRCTMTRAGRVAWTLAAAIAGPPAVIALGIAWPPEYRRTPARIDAVGAPA